MVIIKEGTNLALINPIRVDEKMEKELLALGTITHIFKIGALHSVDIPYYMDKFSPELWMLKDDKSLPNYKTDNYLDENQTLPFRQIRSFNLISSQVPECVLLLPEHNGVLLSCDSIVNMQGDPEKMGNFLVRTLSKLLSYPVYIRPNWVKFAKPKEQDFNDI
jgi:hypothetical protein